MRYVIGLLCALALAACDSQRIYEQNRNIGSEYWYVDSLMTFEFEIESAKESYNLYTNLSHEADYKYRNFYYRYFLNDAEDKEVVADLVNIDLFDSKTGTPLGSGLGDIFDHRKVILQDFTFPNPGKYRLSFQQYMRTDSLPDLVSIGARVELAKPK